MAKPVISEAARRARDALKAQRREVERQQRAEEKAKQPKPPPKPYFVDEAPMATWKAKEKPPPDPQGKFKCSWCGDRCSRVSKRFIGRVNKQKRPLYQVFCLFCARCIYGTVKDSLHDPEALVRGDYRDNDAVLAAARANGTIEQYAHRGLVTFNAPNSLPQDSKPAPDPAASQRKGVYSQPGDSGGKSRRKNSNQGRSSR